MIGQIYQESMNSLTILAQTKSVGALMVVLGLYMYFSSQGDMEAVKIVGIVAISLGSLYVLYSIMGGFRRMAGM